MQNRIQLKQPNLALKSMYFFARPIQISGLLIWQNIYFLLQERSAAMAKNKTKTTSLYSVFVEVYRLSENALHHHTITSF